MDLWWHTSAEYHDLAESFRAFLGSAPPLARADHDAIATMWRRSVDLGFWDVDEDIAVPSVALELLGRALAPVEIMQTALVARPLLGNEFTELVSVVGFDLKSAEATLTADGDRVRGRYPTSSLAAHGERLLVVARSPSGHVAGTAPVPDSAEIDVVLTDPVEVDCQWLQDRLRIGVAVLITGMLDGIVDMCASYARRREQFGVPIGAFQAVKHRIVNNQLDLEIMRSLTAHAVHELDHESPERDVAILSALAFGTRALRAAAHGSVQVHGAMGFTTEMDCHLYVKQAWELEEWVGSSRGLERHLADRLLAGTHA